MKYIQKISMLLLAIYPWLWIYASPLSGINLGDFAFLIIFILFLLYGGNFGLHNYVKEYKSFWIWAAISIVISNIVSFKITYLVPGGVQFFIFSIILGFVVSIFNIKLFINYLRLFFVVTAAIFFLQYLQYIITGHSFSAIIPFLSLTDGLQTSSLMLEQLYSERPSSIFREPAHYVQFLCVFLPVELFALDSEDKLYTILSIVACLILVLLRSGNGLLLLTIVILAKIFSYLKGATQKRRVITIIIIIPVLSVLIADYFKSEAGQGLLDRSSEISTDIVSATSGYLRVIRGYEIYDAMPLFNKIVGSNDDTILRNAGNSKAMFLTGNLQNDLYFNGVQTILLYRGAIGFFFFLILLYRLFKHNNNVSKVLLIILFFVSFIGNTFLSHIMLCTVAIATYYRLNRINIS